MKLNPIGGLRPARGTVSNDVITRLVGRMGGSVQSRDILVLDRPGAVYVQHGFKLTQGLRSAMDRRMPFIIIDHGYFDPRYKTFSISINGFHGLSMGVDVTGLPERPKPKLQPWRGEAEFVTVFGQLPNDRAVRGVNMETWPTRAAQEASQAFLRPAKIRPHPKMINPWEAQLPALASVFEESHVAVTLTSTVGVQAIIAGVPVVAMHPASPAYPVAAHDYQRVRMPGREAWLHDLSYRQYTLAELDKAIEYIERGYPAAAGFAAAGQYDTVGLRV